MDIEVWKDRKAIIVAGSHCWKETGDGRWCKLSETGNEIFRSRADWERIEPSIFD